MPFLRVLVSISLSICAAAIVPDEEQPVIGWQGESFNPKEVFGSDPSELDDVHNGPVQISEHPLAYVWHNFITEREARHVAELAAPRMMRSMVGGGKAIDAVRTSYGMFIPRYQDSVIGHIQERIASWLDVPVVFQEDMQVLRYAPGQQYKPHMDANGRWATVLIYLTDTPFGGETAFPSTSLKDWLDLDLAPQPESLSECARGHVAVKPQVGTAMMFYSLPTDAPSRKNGSTEPVDPMSLHMGCPPEGGLKWTATIWVHPEPFRKESFSEQYKSPMPDPAVCGNFNDSCEHWAAIGECKKNPDYMVGGVGSSGQCRLACKECTPCASDDRQCLSKSRESQGFLPDLEGEFRELFKHQDARIMQTGSQ